MAKRESSEQIELRRKFDVAIETNRGLKATVNDFDTTEELTPEWEMHGNDDVKEGMPDAPEIEITPTPEAGRNYVNVNIMLPQGDSIARGRFINHKRSAEGNPMGNANANPIIDSREYEVQFKDGEVTELAANIIAKSM